MLIFNVPVPLDLEERFIRSGKGDENELVSLLVEGMKKLEAGGADFIVIPCNTVHLFIQQIREAVSIPVLSIVEETAKFLVGKNITKICVISTTRSRKSSLFDGEFRRRGIDIDAVSDEEQEKIDEIIIRVLLFQATGADRARLLEIIDSKNMPVLLACTDLQNIIKPDQERIFDTMEILADSALSVM